MFPHCLHAYCLSSVLQNGEGGVGWQVPWPDIPVPRVSVHVQSSPPGRDGGADREMNFVLQCLRSFVDARAAWGPGWPRSRRILAAPVPAAGLRLTGSDRPRGVGDD